MLKSSNNFEMHRNPGALQHLRCQALAIMVDFPMDDSSFTILVAEDDPNDALLLRRALKKNNIDNPVQIVSDGEEAIDYLQGNGKYADRHQFPRPRFVILDLKMPRMGGLEVLDWLKQNPRFQVIPTLVLSSSKEQQDIINSYRLGANSFMVKPSNFSDLQQLVKVIHDYWVSAQKLDGEDL
jgi:CheY-like chemotaxis protein